MNIDTQCSEEIKAIIRGLQDTPSFLAGIVKDIPDNMLHRRRGDGFWSIAEHVVHLADVQPMLEDRISRILHEDTPEFIPFFPGKDESGPQVPTPALDDALARFKTGRDRILKLLNGANAEEWKRLALHPEYEQYGLIILARHILMHDHWHMYRVEELWLTRDAYLTRLEE